MIVFCLFLQSSTLVTFLLFSLGQDFIGQMLFGSLKGHIARIKCRKCGHTTCHAVNLLYADKPAIARQGAIHKQQNLDESKLEMIILLEII